MLAHVPLLVLAIALLWLPRNWMRRGASLWRRRHRRDHRSGNSLDASGLSFRREFMKARNYADFLRAAIGALALAGGFGIEAVLRADPDVTPRANGKVLAVRAAILLIAVLIQTVRYERKLSLSAPVFFIAGILAAVCPPWAFVSGSVIAWLLTPIVPNVSTFLSVQAVTTVLMTYFLEGIVPLAFFGATLCLLPVVLSLLVNQPLIVLSRTGVSSPRA